MNFEEMYKALDQGKKVRRPSWAPNEYMVLNADGVEESYKDGKVVALGYRVWNIATEPTDWELYQGLT